MSGGQSNLEMALHLPSPDLTISIYPDRCAPRAARYCVGTIERPPAGLRESVVLLTSELVSRAVRRHQSTSPELFELRIWMRRDIARVELRGARELLCAAPQPGDPEDDLRLVDALADRWSIESDERGACIWFEIDCHRAPGRPGGRCHSRTSFPRFRHSLNTGTPRARPQRCCIASRAHAAWVAGSREASARSVRRMRSHR
jgi:hypothetical protein